MDLESKLMRAFMHLLNAARVALAFIPPFTYFVLCEFTHIFIFLFISDPENS